MVTFLIKRLAVLVSTLLVVSFMVFLIPYLTPGDPARKILRARISDLNADPAAIESLREQYGLDRPLLVQYADWLGDALRGEFGLSYTSRTPVVDMVGNALSVTAVLAIATLLLALLVAVPLGSLAAVKRRSPTDTAITTVTQAFVAIPEYWLAPVLVLVFALNLGVLPSSGWDGPQSMVLPCLTLALRPMSYFTQVTRASMIDVLASPHMTAARARGLGFGAAMARHGVRNAMLPVLTLFSVWLAGLLGGSVVVEVIFTVPGMGRLLYESVVNNDIPAIQAGIVSLVGLAVVITTLTDVIYTWINPTVRTAHVSA
jgi:peptide/nickel transport system permease protein